MKILHLHKGFYLNDFGGVERMAFELSKATQKNGCKNVVITISNNTYFERDIKNVKVINFKRDFSLFNNPFSLNALIHFYKIQKKVTLFTCTIQTPLAILHYC